MESLLYIVSVKSNWLAGGPSGLLPEAVQMSVGEAIRLNAWALVAVGAAFASRWLLHDPGLAGWARVGVALSPLVPGLLYVCDLVRWMQRLDEMQRRLQGEAVTFALMIMVVLGMTLDLLHNAGFAERVHFGWEGTFAFTFFLYALGMARANRAYR